jgi:hypothetical protein
VKIQRNLAPVEASADLTTPLNIAQINFVVGLSQLASGKYGCQVTVLDLSGVKEAFWEAPMMLVP